jgi:hypothetical protein
VAVILSGLDGDGNAALKAIKSAGGLTFAQSDASYDSMPRTAVESGHIDYLQPASGIAEALLALAHKPLQTVDSHSSSKRDFGESGAAVRITYDSHSAAEEINMNKTIGAILTVRFLLALAWGAFTYTTREKLVDIGLFMPLAKSPMTFRFRLSLGHWRSSATD